MLTNKWNRLALLKGVLLTLVITVCCGPRTFADDAAPAKSSVMLQDFEKDSSLPKLWVVNIPDQNAAVSLSTDHPFQGKQSVKLHYHFTGNGQYLGLDNPVTIHAPVHKLHFQVYGDNSGTGYGVYLIDASGKTHKYRDAATMKIDFTGWKEITVDLDGQHEQWGGKADGKIDYPISRITFEISTPGKEIESDLFFDAISADSEGTVDETLGGQISVTSPDYCSDIKGDTKIDISAPSFKNLTVHCWKQGEGFGSDSIVAKVDLDTAGKGSFTFPADQYPHGPVTLTISGENKFAKDNCYLQLYNKSGVSWNEGLPKDPDQAKGMPLAFSDDFSGELSISSENDKTRYYDHKPPNGSQDFSSIPFTSFNRPNNPFAKVDNYLRIRADAKANSAGLLSSLKNDGSGVEVSLPCYFECRFVGPNAVGSWPAFWLLTDNINPSDIKGVDELDIIEAYGGEGPANPNSYDAYQITPHMWAQGDAANATATANYKMMNPPCHMKKFGIPSTWYETFHTYGCKITDTDTIYYCDNIEVGRHPTQPVSKQRPFFFLINLATGGGWPVDLSRYDGKADMYVDFVRVYGKK